MLLYSARTGMGGLPLRFALVVVAAGIAMAQPPVSYESLDGVHVYLLPPGSPEFEAKLGPEGKRVPGALLPYAVLIQNDSERNIVAWSIRWVFRFANRPLIHADWTSYNFLTLKPEDGIPAGKGRVATERGDAQPTYLPLISVEEDHAAERARLYSAAVSATVSIESVLFDDGGTAGPDRNGWKPRLKAMLDAERDLTDEVLAAPSPAAARRIVADVQNAAYGLLPPDWPHDYPSLWRFGFLHSRGYDQAYAIFKAEVGTRELENMSNQGEQAELIRLRRWRSGRRYPGEPK